MNICVFGASITWGACDYDKGGWVERLKIYLMENHEDADVYNLGIPGQTTEDLLKRFENEASVREPEIIIFGIGTNDARYVNTPDNLQTPPEKYRPNLLELIKLAKKYTDKIIFVGLTPVDEKRTMPIPWSPTKYYSNNNLKRHDQIIREVCQQEKLPYIDVMDKIEQSELEDGLHPDAVGHRKIFESLKEVIDPLVGS